MIHQAIETIEFVLGSVSNTASYLRLWALSLAHSQLAEVFLNMLVMPYMQGTHHFLADAAAIVLMMTAWAFVTAGVILLMDFMECCLHALRLQWVEYQNKFYKGDGYSFVAFSFLDYNEEKFESN